MNSSLSRSDYQQYRAPRETDGFLIEPSIADGLKQCELSFDQAACAEIKVAGQTLSELRLEARKEVLQLALRYTQAYLPEATQTSFPTTPSSPLFMSGHQPELFHPGVWFKNFLLDELARQGQGIAINFIVDNDLCRSTSIRIPTLEQDKWSVQRVDFDSQQLSSVDTPWELRDIASQETWTKFPNNVRKALPPVQGSEPLLVEQLWEFASDRLAQGYKLGHALAAARHQIEWSHGLRTLEVPMSLLARTDSFAKFSLHVLTDLARFQSAYNEQRESYRREHRIKNQAQPVPKLERFHEWLEAPLWIYQETAPERLPLWVRTEDAQLTLSNRSGWEATLESPQGDLETSLQQWQTLSSQGVCLRPRALMTTMFTRMVTSDLFVHGIGGGKYDQVTEGIIQSYFGLKSPPVIVATATKNLPWQTPLDAVPTLQSIWKTQSKKPGAGNTIASSGHKSLVRKPLSSPNKSRPYLRKSRLVANAGSGIMPCGTFNNDSKNSHKGESTLRRHAFVNLRATCGNLRSRTPENTATSSSPNRCPSNLAHSLDSSIAFQSFSPGNAFAIRLPSLSEFNEE